MDNDPLPTPPAADQPETPEETRKYLDGLTIEETFHIGQSLGRVLERLELHTGRLDDLKTSIDETDGKVSHLVREFGYIKKAWWAVLIALGFVLAEILDYLPTLFPDDSG